MDIFRGVEMRERKWREKKKKKKRNHMVRPESRISLIKISNYVVSMFAFVKKEKKRVNFKRV